MIVDSSALIAIIFKEPGHEPLAPTSDLVEDATRRGSISVTV